MFIERIEVKEKKVSKVTYTPLFQSLIDAQTVRIRHDLLEKRSINITKRFLRIIEIFQDAKFEQQLRLEIEKVKPILTNLI